MNSFVKVSFALVGSVALTGCCLFDCGKPVARAVSQNGRNEICLRMAPLGYEVVRDGKTVVAKGEIGVKLDGTCLPAGAKLVGVTSGETSGTIDTPFYKKAKVSLDGRWTLADFGSFAVRLAARDDGVAYRLELKRGGRIDCEKADLVLPDRDVKCRVNYTNRYGCEETVNETMPASEIRTDGDFHKVVYLPLVYETDGTTVVVTESDVHDYPIWNFTRAEKTDGSVRLTGHFPAWPKTTAHFAGWGKGYECPPRGRWIRIREHEDYLVDCAGPRTLPWRTFILADKPSELCEKDIVFALARPQIDCDFSWVKPGKVAWDWWNSWDNKGETNGCTTANYERFIDFAAKTGVEYVILDEGWSENLNIWKFSPKVDVPHLIDYAEKRGVGIILWMAWAQIAGDEARVAEHFGKLGARGFKVDFMSRGDAEVDRFLWTFADECAKRKLLLDYHGAHRPTGMERAYPNVLNFESVHGLEQMKWYNGKDDFMENDLKVFFCRMTVGPMDYTPGAMDNYPIGKFGGSYDNPGSFGTRCRQMAMMPMYFAPLQMLSDAPSKYERNMECFRFMAATPVVWDETVGLGGTPETFAACARRKGGVWYAAAMTSAAARDFSLDTKFLGDGAWTAEIFRDAADADVQPTHYVHETKRVKAGETMPFRMSKGGGFVVRFSK